MIRFAGFAIAVMLSAGVVDAQQIGDPTKGSELARDTCSRCHAVGRVQSVSPNPRAPTFVELATAPGMTGAALMVAMTTPHAGMPMFTLNAEQREDIIAYILSLK